MVDLALTSSTPPAATEIYAWALAIAKASNTLRAVFTANARIRCDPLAASGYDPRRLVSDRTGLGASR